ncbi:MAG: preprotein translocase subunit SecY [Anaerolineales bacterium]|jgi:preprotein translocase subunit SecY
MKRSAWRYLWTAKDIRRKLLITLGILVIYRLAAHVPVPGADRAVIAQMMSGGGAETTLLSIMNMLSGGTVSNFSVLAMGVYPYITAQIILQLLVPVVPALKARMEDDPREGQKWMEKWTMILAIPMSALQAIGQINIFSTFAGQPIITDFGFGSVSQAMSSLAIVASMTAGTMFAIWLGELISEFGIRNQGLSLLIFAGIVASIPQNFARLLNPASFADAYMRWVVLGTMLVVIVLIIFAIVFVQQGQRNVPVMYPGRRVGNRMSMPVKGTLPLRVNMAGMIPIIFAQSLLTFPAIIANFFVNSETTWVSNLALSISNVFGGSSNWYWILFFLMVVGFTFFYTDVLFAQQNYGENLKRAGARIPGVSPGPPTQRYLTRVLRRITFPGAVFLGFIAIVPFIIGLVFQLGPNTNIMLVSTTGLLIVVGVVRDTFFNINAELKLHGYDETLLVR